MIEARNLVARCAPSSVDQEVEEYLASILLSHQEECTGDGSSDIDREELYETINQFFENSDASRKLLDLWEETLASNKITSGIDGNNLPAAPAKLSLGGEIKDDIVVSLDNVDTKANATPT